MKILVKEAVKAQDKLDTHKKWFNGMKHFIMVKLLPKNK